MPAKVSLKFVKGAAAGRVFVCQEKESLIFGRMDDASIPVTDNTVSRYHCLMELNPPDVVVRDFGSMNGTFLNRKKIGAREKGMSAEEGRKLEFEQFPLKDGDILGLGPDCEMAVAVYTPKFCAGCSCELDEAGTKQFEAAPGVFLCPPCHEKKLQDDLPVQKKQARCMICGCTTDKDPGAGDIICDTCLLDPMKLLDNLLQKAVAGQGDAGFIKGYRKLGTQPLGRGGMGEVWLVEEEATGREMVLKLMLPKVAVNEKNRDKFLLEALIAGQLHHKNVLRVISSGCSDGTFFMLMDLCRGGSVDKLMARHGGKLKPDLAVPIIIQVLDGLEYAHNAVIKEVKLQNGKTTAAHGVVHRDLSPHNIFLDDPSGQGTAMVADFGLGKAFETAGLTGNTRTGMTAGKPVFMPRQQVINFKYAKPDVDVWAAAASLYFMLTGKFPKDFPAGVDMWHAALNNAAVPIRKRDASVPTRLAEAIDAALVDKPQIKVKTAGDFRRMLEKAL